MKYLVTGGAGFIGSNYLHYVVNLYKDDIFVCLDTVGLPSKYNNIIDLESYKNYKFIIGSTLDEVFINNLFENEKFDIVVNFAGESSVDKSIKDPLRFIESNVKGTSILLEASRKNNVKRFHQISTIEVYGGFLDQKEVSSFDETSQLNPLNPYAATKACADLLVLSYYKTYNLPVTISRSTNNFGPYQLDDKLIPLTITKALSNDKINLYGTGENKRDWIYVLDHVRAIDLIIKNGSIGEIYNISAHNQKSNLEIIEFILNKLNKSNNLINFINDRPGNYFKTVIDSNKIEKELDWKPKYKFEEALTNTIEWYKSNKP